MDYNTIVDATRNVLTQYDMPLTLRQLYYRLVSSQLFENTFRNYKNLGRILVMAREQGHIDDSKFEDRARYSSRSDYGFASPEEYLKNADDYFMNCEQTSNFLWAHQPRYVEVWVEKDALRTLVEQITRRYRIRLNIGRGYASYTFVKDAAKRIEEALDNNPEREPIILYLGDHDPSGVNIQDDLRKRIMRYSQSVLPEDMKIIRVAITPKQIEQYQLPTAPVRTNHQGIPTDPRANEFLKVHGNATVELDAIDPPELQKLIDLSIRACINTGPWNEAVDQIESERATLKEKCSKIKQAIQAE